MGSSGHTCQSASMCAMDSVRKLLGGYVGGCQPLSQNVMSCHQESGRHYLIWVAFRASLKCFYIAVRSFRVLEFQMSDLCQACGNYKSGKARLVLDNICLSVT